MAIISFYGRKIIFGHFLRCNWTCLLSKVFASFFGGIWYKNGLFGATTHHYIDFTALNAGKKKERKSHFCTQLYHHARNGRLFRAGRRAGRRADLKCCFLIFVRLAFCQLQTWRKRIYRKLIFFM